jgi:hypothetical protein
MHDLSGWPLPISLVVIDLSIIHIGLVAGVVGIQCVLGIADIVDVMRSRCEAFLVE